MRGLVGGTAESPTTEPVEDEDRNEKRLQLLLRIARGKYLEKKLEGNICIYVELGPFTTQVSCDVGGDGGEEVVGAGEMVRVKSFNSIVIA